MTTTGGSAGPTHPGGGGDGDLIVEPAEPIAYRLYRSVVPATPARPAACIVIPTFDVDGPERQRHIVDVIAGPADQAPAAVPGLIGAHFHLSLDGTRVFNYAEWIDENAHRRMVETTPTTQVEDWRTEITSGTPGVRFTGWKRYRLVATVVP